MSIPSWLQSLCSSLAPRRSEPRRGSCPAAALRLNLELLEERLTPSFTWIGSFPPDQYPPQAAPASWQLSGDFTSDGIPDQLNMTVTNGWWLTVRPGRGDGTFGNPIYSQLGSLEYIQCMAVADFNGDGRLDFVLTEATMDMGGNGCTLLGRGDGTFYGQEFFPLGMDTPTGIGIGDIDGDGTQDLAVTGWVNINWAAEEAVVVLLNDSNWAPYLSVSNSGVKEGNTGTANATFLLTLSYAANVDVTVHYETADISATAGSDYVAASGDVTIPAGQTSRTITVAVKGDRVPEPNETFGLRVTDAANARIANEGVGVINDDEPRISIGDLTKSEGKKNQTTLFTFTVTLAAPYDQAVTMSFRTVDGTAKTSDQDYVAKTGTLTFAPGETTKTITIEVRGDSKKESSETFYLDLLGNSNNSQFTKNRGLGTILNDD